MAKIRSRKLREHNSYVMYKGYKVYESGVVYGKLGKIIKPKFMLKGKRIDYVYIDYYDNGKKRMSYHRFIYKAFNPTFDDDNMVITTIGSRFDYRISNLKCISREEHLREVAESAKIYQGDDLKEMLETYELVKDFMTLEEYANRLHISSRTLSNYIRKEKDEQTRVKDQSRS